MIARLLGMLHRDERGQIVPMFMLGILALVALLALVLNTGNQVNARIKVQDAADAAAVTQAAWTARSLNVISMNNVAITQAFAINVITTALLAPLTEASLKAAEKLNTYIECIKICWPLALDLSYRVIRPLVRIWMERPDRIISRSNSIVRALEEMNEQTVREFPKLSGDLARKMAKTNGLRDDVPRFYSGWERNGRCGSKVKCYETSTLPIEEVSLSYSGAMSVFDSVPLCSTGNWGTPRFPDIFWNFQEHGYPRNRGPYNLGHDSVDSEITAPIDALEDFPHFKSVKADFKKIAKGLWNITCLSRRLPTGHKVKLYKTKNRPTPMMRLARQRDDWSILAFTRLRQGDGPAMSTLYKNPAHAVYGYAQAEVFNPISYDLYTQDWRAMLTPARLLNNAKRSAVAAVDDYTELQKVLTEISDAELETVNAH